MRAEHFVPHTCLKPLSPHFLTSPFAVSHRLTVASESGGCEAEASYKNHVTD